MIKLVPIYAVLICLAFLFSFNIYVTLIVLAIPSLLMVVFGFFHGKRGIGLLNLTMFIVVVLALITSLSKVIVDMEVQGFIKELHFTISNLIFSIAISSYIATLTLIKLLKNLLTLSDFKYILLSNFIITVGAIIIILLKDIPGLNDLAQVLSGGSFTEKVYAQLYMLFYLVPYVDIFIIGSCIYSLSVLMLLIKFMKKYSQFTAKI